MNISKAIISLREQVGLSQEKFAQMLNVSRQAVQKWESGASVPELYNVISISKIFNVSVDYLLLDINNRDAKQQIFEKKMEPKFSMIDQGEVYSSQLLTEYKQLLDEGKDIEKYGELFNAVDKMPAGSPKEQIADILFGIVLNTPQRSDYAYIEPSGLEEIKKLRSEYVIPVRAYDKAVLRKKICGSWMGRICGCLLGKPIEGIRTDELIPILKESANYPMYRYIHSADITEEMHTAYKFNLHNKCYADVVSCAPADDDTNYTVLSAELIEKCGRNFTPDDVICMWIDKQSKNCYFTAERIAYRNFTLGYFPSDSATYKNPYREWIGAQIRGDYFGFINPGNPESAAEMAWRDASISHVKNGIYGEMYIAAMLACAAVCDNMEQIILGGIAQIPATSRLFESILCVLNDYKSGVSSEHCFEKIHSQYDEHSSYGWCHTIPNAMIVTSALLYGQCDYSKSICLAVQTGFDTDCNGATVGSIVGMLKGIDAIPSQWQDPVGNELDTTIFGIGKVKISDMVELTLKHLEL